MILICHMEFVLIPTELVRWDKFCGNESKLLIKFNN
jgi:hypothetical protein